MFSTVFWPTEVENSLNSLATTSSLSRCLFTVSISNNVKWLALILSDRLSGVHLVGAYEHRRISSCGLSSLREKWHTNSKKKRRRKKSGKLRYAGRRFFLALSLSLLFGSAVFSRWKRPLSIWVSSFLFNSYTVCVYKAALRISAFTVNSPWGFHLVRDFIDLSTGRLLESLGISLNTSHLAGEVSVVGLSGMVACSANR